VVIENTIEQAVLADRLGYGCWWQVEHHGAVGFSNSSTPELMLTALATATKNIRLGQAGVLTPHQINHPLRIAERAGFIDLLSGGRFEMGLARSGGGEWTTFGVDGETTAPSSSRSPSC
jgi:alkanesulfonate monooxygenase SsuD/methylene tetrahydromethanopterin reductase-like flavin-dependent oxidoreductase (luciferase family)